MLREEKREMEHESFPHLIHEHPLSLIPDYSKKGAWYNACCNGCCRNFIPGDATYGCSLGCGFRRLLHKECMEMPREIMHPIHPSHPLTLHLDSNIISGSKICAVCKFSEYLDGLRYRCSQGGCDGLWIHLGCSGFLTDKQPLMYHPSHPHQLRFSKKTRWCPFPCDACGATEKGNSYICTLCDYCIHESCALLPLSKEFPLHHPTHALSLAFSLPSEYIEYGFDCAICTLTLPLRRWFYHCNLCKYVVHLNCATSTFDNETNAIDDAIEVTKFPMAEDDIYEEMIRPFVKRQRGKLDIIPLHDHDNHISGKYSFSNHPHHLTFTTFSLASSSSSSSFCKKDDEEDDDEDDFDSIPRSKLICDGCALAIHEKKQTADDDEYENGYMSCDECKYILHLSCFNLPLHIPSLPIHPLKDHSLMLRNAGKLTDWERCYICEGCTNGLYYDCTNKYCSFKIDIKCASLPNAIKHALHTRHNYLKLAKGDYSYHCVNCHTFISTRIGEYRCNSCRFRVCHKCVLQPATNKHRLENHLLSLTYRAYVNRPGDFYCSSCEDLMNPRMWMYHCRDCDQSFHPKCFPATSGEYRNIKYGTEQCVISSIHDHPLRFQIITNKKRCDLCHHDAYDKPGFQCASCFFAVCIECGMKHLGDA